MSLLLTASTDRLLREMEVVADLIDRHHFTGTDENSLQAGLALVFSGAGIAHEREVSLSRRDRIDVLLPASGIGIECKVKGGSNQVAAQLIRYLGHDRIHAVILVTSKIRLGQGLPSSLAITGADRIVRAKPLRVISVRRAFL